MTFAIPNEHRDARSQASITYADSQGAGSKIELRDAGGVLLVTIVLSYPCGIMEGGFIRLDQLSPTGDQIAADGVAATGTWLRTDNTVVATGTVTDAAGNGDFKIASAAGVNLYAGGYVLLGVTALN
ncbi:MAG: hypothetical protein JWP93_274 [Polaromonas sp.]|nr:hypothetical protein [Polaromonas sp.]